MLLPFATFEESAGSPKTLVTLYHAERCDTPEGLSVVFVIPNRAFICCRQHFGENLVCLPSRCIVVAFISATGKTGAFKPNTVVIIS